MARNVRDGRGGHRQGLTPASKPLYRADRDSRLRRSLALALRDADDEQAQD